MSFDPLAMAAFFISCISLVLSIEGRLNDRFKLKCNSHMFTTFGPGQETYRIVVEVTNFGRRPVSIVEISYKDNEMELNSDEFAISSHIYGGLVDRETPAELAENQTKAFSSGEIKRRDLLKKTKRLDVVVRDSRGKVYVNTIDNDAYTGAAIEAEAAKLEIEQT